MAQYWLLPRNTANSSQYHNRADTAAEAVSKLIPSEWTLVKVDDYGATVVNYRLNSVTPLQQQLEQA